MNIQSNLDDSNLTNVIKNQMAELGIEIKDFKPIAYYEPKHRDAFIFQIKDCSFREIEFNDFTLMLENHVPGKELVGIKIHNIKNRLTKLKTNEKLVDYIKDVLQNNGQFFNNTESFLKICEELEINNS